VLVAGDPAVKMRAIKLWVDNVVDKDKNPQWWASQQRGAHWERDSALECMVGSAGGSCNRVVVRMRGWTVSVSLLQYLWFGIPSWWGEAAGHCRITNPGGYSAL